MTTEITSENFNMSECNLGGYVLRDSRGNIILDEEENITCICEDGLEFKINSTKVDFRQSQLLCEFNNKIININIFDKVQVVENENHCTFGSISNTTTTSTAQSAACTQLNENNNTNKTSIFCWNDATTKLFLTLYSEKRQLFNERKIKTLKVLYKKIAEKMNEKGYNVTDIQVENKFKSMERAYKTSKLNNKKTGRARSRCSFEDELDEILGNRHNIRPLALSSTNGLTIRKDVQSNNTAEYETLLEEENVDDPDNFTNATEVGESIAIASTNSESTSLLTLTNTNCIANKKEKRIQLGKTAQIIQKCQKALDDFTKDCKTYRNNEEKVHMEILKEQREIRIIYENSLQTMKEQNEKMFQLMKEKNDIFRELMKDSRNNNN